MLSPLCASHCSSPSAMPLRCVSLSTRPEPSLVDKDRSRLKSTEDFAPEKQGFIMILFSSRCCEKLINLGILMLIVKEISLLEGVVEHRLFLDMATAGNIAGNTSLDVKTK
ncbi:hypothetical protein NL676_030967 [Syzygium grande]|nr:hypothetical protein NL676_030967 [Syzygium grande]